MRAKSFWVKNIHSKLRDATTSRDQWKTSTQFPDHHLRVYILCHPIIWLTQTSVRLDPSRWTLALLASKLAPISNLDVMAAFHDVIDVHIRIDLEQEGIHIKRKALIGQTWIVNNRMGTWKFPRISMWNDVETARIMSVFNPGNWRMSHASKRLNEKHLSRRGNCSKRSLISIPFLSKTGCLA